MKRIEILTQLIEDTRKLHSGIKESDLHFKEQIGQLLWDALTYLASAREVLQDGRNDCE